MAAAVAAPPAAAAAPSATAAPAAAGGAATGGATPTAKVCAVCSKTAAESNVPKLKVCGGCGDVAYCSREHQTEHWKSHKLVCKQKHKAVTERDIEVLWDDQKRINAFGKLNNRLQELDDNIKAKKNDVETHKDAVDLLDMALDDDAVKLRVGEVFIDVEGDDAETAVKGKLKAVRAGLAELQKEREQIVAEMTNLKAILYAKFGKSINLEVKDESN